MAEVLMKAMGCDVREDSPDCDHDGYCGGHGKFTYCVEHDSDEWLDAEAGKVCKFAAHQADVLAAAGYGKLEDAWDEGFTSCASEHLKQRSDPEYPITRTNPYHHKAYTAPESRGILGQNLD